MANQEKARTVTELLCELTKPIPWPEVDTYDRDYVDPRDKVKLRDLRLLVPIVEPLRIINKLAENFEAYELARDWVTSIPERRANTRFLRHHRSKAFLEEELFDMFCYETGFAPRTMREQGALRWRKSVDSIEQVVVYECSNGEQITDTRIVRPDGMMVYYNLLPIISPKRDGRATTVRIKVPKILTESSRKGSPAYS